jgi:hypothetical protein
MAALPFFAMPRKQVQDILVALKPQDRERVEKGLEHSRTLFDLCGKHIRKLKAHIERRLPECKYNIKKSKLAVELCYATLLVEDTEPQGIRWEFDESDYEHVFGDMYIVQTAIYLGTKIMTKDRKLSQMASYAGIKCCHVPEVKQVQDYLR